MLDLALTLCSVKRRLDCTDLFCFVVTSQIRVSVEPPDAGALSFREHGPVISPSYASNVQSAPVISLRSAVNQGNMVLEGLHFSPAADFYGSAVLNVEVNDGGACGQGNVLSANSSVTIGVTAVNDPPNIVVPRLHRRSGGRGPLKIEGIEVDDVDHIDGESVAVSITADAGSISVDPSPAILVSSALDEEDPSTAGVTLVGLLSDVRSALSRVWFVPMNEGWEGGSVVHVSATDGNGATGTADCVVVVSDPDIEPSITAVNETFVVDQASRSSLSGLSASDLVTDAAFLAGLPSPVFNVTVTTDLGGVGLFPVPPGLSPVPGSETAKIALSAIVAGKGLAGVFGTPRSALSFRGMLPEVNAALAALTYLSANGTAGLGNHSVIVEVSRQGKLQKYSARRELVVDVRPVNLPPIIHWDPAAAIPESPDLGGFSLRGLSVSDSDLADGGLLRVQIEALAEGDNVVVRSAGTGLDFLQGSAHGVPSSAVAFRGNSTCVTDALSASAAVLDAPGAPRALVPALRVTVADGDGGESSRMVEVYGTHVNSPPEVTIDNPQMTLQEGGVLVRVGEMAGVHINDADAEDLSYGFLEVNVSVSHRAVLEVQNITTSATSSDPVQTIITRSTGGTNYTVGGTFNLTIDLTGLCEGCGVEETGPIWHDAVGNEDDVRVGFGSGSEPGESIQAKLQTLPSFQALGVTVFCQRDTRLSLQGGREWQVTFLGAPASLPTMHAIGDSLTGDNPSVEVSYTVKGNSLSGSFSLHVCGYHTPPIRYDADAGEVAAALEGLPIVVAVDVTMPYPIDLQGGRHWAVTFFDAFDAGGDAPLMEADGQSLGGRGAAVQVVEAVRGAGIAELWEVDTSAARHNLISVISMTGALHAKGYFQLGLNYGGRHAWTRPIYPQAVGPVSDEDGPRWSYGGIPGQKRGESVEARLLALENWSELGPDAQVVVKRVESTDGDTVEWTLTFSGAPGDLEGPNIESTHLTGSAKASIAVAVAHNQVQGFFSLAYGGAATPPLGYDSSGAEIAAALNVLHTLHAQDTGTGAVAVTNMQGTTLQGGRRWSIAFLSDSEISANLTAVGTSTTGLLGASARASVTLVRRGGRGAILRLVDLGGEAFGLPGYTTGEHLTVRGKPHMVTSALASLSYSPRRGWNGGADIIFRAYDGGFTGSGGPQTGWGLVFAAVEAVNNPPELLWCGTVLGWGGAKIEDVDEDAPFRLVDYDCESGSAPTAPTAFDHSDFGGPGAGLQVRDPDGGASLLEVRWNCTAYTLNWARCSSQTLSVSEDVEQSPVALAQIYLSIQFRHSRGE